MEGKLFSPTGAKCNKILRYPPFQEFPTFVPKKNLDEAARENGVFILSGVSFPSLLFLTRSYFLVHSHLEILLAFCVKHSEFLRNRRYRRGLSVLKKHISALLFYCIFKWIETFFILYKSIVSTWSSKAISLALVQSFQILSILREFCGSGLLKMYIYIYFSHLAIKKKSPFHWQPALFIMLPSLPNHV